jgi:hypothetical protein
LEGCGCDSEDSKIRCSWLYSSLQDILPLRP